MSVKCEKSPVSTPELWDDGYFFPILPLTSSLMNGTVEKMKGVFNNVLEESKRRRPLKNRTPQHFTWDPEDTKISLDTQKLLKNGQSFPYFDLRDVSIRNLG